MKNLFTITIHFLRQTFSSKFRYILFIAGPVISIVLLTLLFSISGTGGFSVGYVNRDNGPLGEIMISSLRKSKNNRLLPWEEKQLNQGIIEGEIIIGLIIPEDFSGSLMAGTPPGLKLSALKEEGSALFLENSINRFTANLTGFAKLAEGDKKKFDVMLKRFMEKEYTLTTTTLADSGMAKEGSARSIGFFLFFIFIQATLITGLLLKEKENHTFDRIRVAPVKETLYSAGNMLAALIILVAQIGFTLIICSVVLKIDLYVPLPQLFILLSAFSIAVLGIGILITSLTASSLQGALLANLIVIPTSMLGGSFWPVEMMPPFMQKFALFCPQSWTMKAVESLQDGASFSTAIPTLLLLTGVGVLFLMLFAFNMRHNRRLTASD